MDEYVKSKLRPIEVPRGYLSNTKEISDGMLTNVKGVNGGLGWLASTARPDMSAPHSIIPSGFDRRSTQLISEVNAAVKQCHAVPITITIWPIPFAELRCTTFTDSSFDTGERQRHQQGWLVCATDKYFNQERSAPVSVLHWRTRKLTRKAGRPQLVETFAASSAVVEMTWIKVLWESMTWRDFDILTQRRSSRPLRTMMPQKALQHPAQDPSEAHLAVHVDSDWAADTLTSRSTSGVNVRRGRHLLRHSSTVSSTVQNVSGLSSAQSEYCEGRMLRTGSAKLVGRLEPETTTLTGYGLFERESHAACKRTDTIFSDFTKLRHWLSPSSTSSPHFTRLSVFANSHFVHDLRCKTRKLTRNGLSSAIRTLVFCSAEFRRVLHCRFTSLTAISTQPLPM